MRLDDYDNDIDVGDASRGGGLGSGGGGLLFGLLPLIGSRFGAIPSGFPVPQVPVFRPELVLTLLSPTLTIAMLGAIEALLSAVVADGMAGTRHDSNQELIGQGIANIVAPLFGGFAATGAIARTATNVRNGATSPLAGIMHALTLIAILLFLAPLAASIPLSVLAAILFIVAWNMSEVERVVFLPAGNPWQRAGGPSASAAHRAEMVRLAIAHDDAFTLDERELRRAGPTYTVDTLREVRTEQGPAAPLVFLCGSDAAASLSSWHR